MGIRPPSHWLRRAGEVSIVCVASAGFAPSALSASGLRPLDIALVVGFLILSLGIHEAAHAYVAWRCGDSTAKDLGRMTLNPIAHIDPFLTIILPALLFIAGAPPFGGAKPVPVSYQNLRRPLRDMALVALAGPASNFLLAIVFGIAMKVCMVYGHYEIDTPVIQVLMWSMFANLSLTAFNLLPIPPLDGSRVMTWLLPAQLRPGYVALERFGILLVFGLIYFVPQLRAVLNEMMDGMWYAVDNLTGFIG